MQIGKCLSALFAHCPQVAVGGTCALVQCLISNSLWGCVCSCVFVCVWPHITSNEPQWWPSSGPAYWSLACCPRSNFQQGSAGCNKKPVRFAAFCSMCLCVCDFTSNWVFRVCTLMLRSNVCVACGEAAGCFDLLGCWNSENQRLASYGNIMLV